MRFAVHAVYYADRKARLVRDCLIPVADAVARQPGVENVYLQRHWRFGPHVRVCVRTVDAAAARHAGATAQRSIESFVQRHPSTERLDPVNYAAVSRALGSRELVAPPYEPIWPDNSVAIADYDTQIALFGHDEALRFKEAFLERALPAVGLLLDTIQHAEPQRLAYAARILVLLASTYPDGGVIRGYMSLRSHVEDFLFEHDATGTLRRTFEDRLAELGAPMRATVRQIIREVDGAHYTGVDPVLKAFGGLFEYGWQTALPLAERGILTEDPAILSGPIAEAFDAKTRDRWNPSPERKWSEFHTALRQLNFAPQRVGVVTFSAYRWLMNLTYSLLPLLDVSPLERYCLSYVIAGATEAEFNTSWREILTGVRERYSA